MIVKIEDAHRFFYSVKVKKYQRGSIYENITTFESYGVVLDVPGREIATFVSEYCGGWCNRGKAVQISLIGETIALDPSVAPFDATIFPPFETFSALIATTEGDPPDIVDAESFKFSPTRSKVVWNNRDGGVPNLVEYFIW